MDETRTLAAALERAGLSEQVPLGWCMLTALNLEHEGSWVPLYTRIRFGYGTAPGARDPIEFTSVEFIEKVHPPSEMLELIEKQGALPIGHAEIEFGPQERPWDYTSPRGDWPRAFGKLRTHRFGRRGERLFTNVPDPLLARAGGPAFRGLPAAIRHWFEVDGFLANDCCQPQLEVHLSLPPGTVDRFEASEGRFLVRLQTDGGEEEMEVHLAWEDSRGHRNLIASPTSGCAEFPDLPRGEFAIFVLKRGEIIDRCLHSPYAHGAIPGIEPTEDSVAVLVSRGECETCEFKKAPPDAFDDGSKQKEFWRKVMKSVIAFANTEGGWLLFGVLDDGEIEGVDHILRALGEGSLEEGRNRMERRIRQKMQNSLIRSPEIEFRWEPVEGVQILKAFVSQQTEGVTETLQHDVFVRRGSSCLRPDAAERRELSRPAEGYPGLPGGMGLLP